MGTDVCYFLPLFLSLTPLMVHISHYSPFLLLQRLLSFLFPLKSNSGKLVSSVFIPLFLSFFLTPPPPFFSHPVLSDYNSGDGPVKASPIIVFEQHCSLALCSSDTYKYSAALSVQLRQEIHHIYIHTVPLQITTTGHFPR